MSGKQLLRPVQARLRNHFTRRPAEVVTEEHAEMPAAYADRFRYLIHAKRHTYIAPDIFQRCRDMRVFGSPRKSVKGVVNARQRRSYQQGVPTPTRCSPILVGTPC